MSTLTPRSGRGAEEIAENETPRPENLIRLSGVDCLTFGCRPWDHGFMAVCHSYSPPVGGFGSNVDSGTRLLIGAKLFK